MNKILKNTIGGLSLGAAVLLGQGCADIAQNEVVALKGWNGTVSFHHGPKWEYLGRGSETTHWNGERIIHVPLDNSTESSSHMTTRDGKALDLFIDMIYKLDSTDAALNNFYVTQDDAEYNFPKQADGVARSVVSQYDYAQIMNMNHPSLAKENKPPIYEGIQNALKHSSINSVYGIDTASWEVWPVNLSPLAANVQRDLEKQVNVMVNRFRGEAQLIERQAIHIKAQVDSSYSVFTRSLSNEQLDYLKTVQIQRTLGNYASSEKKDAVSIVLSVGGK
jgi:hypothetical protein